MRSGVADLGITIFYAKYLATKTEHLDYFFVCTCHYIHVRFPNPTRLGLESCISWLLPEPVTGECVSEIVV